MVLLLVGKFTIYHLILFLGRGDKMHTWIMWQLFLAEGRVRGVFSMKMAFLCSFLWQITREEDETRTRERERARGAHAENCFDIWKNSGHVTRTRSTIWVKRRLSRVENENLAYTLCVFICFFANKFGQKRSFSLFSCFDHRK